MAWHGPDHPERRVKIEGPEFQTASSAMNPRMNHATSRRFQLNPCSTGTPDTCSCRLTVLEFYSIISSVRFVFYLVFVAFLVVFTED